MVVACWSCCVSFLTCGCVKDCLDWVTRSNTDYEPRLEAEYHHILKFKGEKAVWYKPPNSKLSIAQLKYRSDLVDKVVFHRDWWDDFITYTRNANAYISPWTAARLHPFSRSERLVVVILSMVASLSLAMYRAGLIAQQRQRFDEKGGTPAPTAEGQADKAQSVLTLRIVFGILNPVMLFVFTKVLSVLGTCSIAQGTQCAAFKECCESASHGLMCLLGFTVVTSFLLYGIIYTVNFNLNVSALFLGFFFNLLISALVISPLVSSVRYEWKRRNEVNADLHHRHRIAQGKSVNQCFYVSISDYENWKAAGSPTFNGDGPMSEEDTRKADGHWVNAARDSAGMVSGMASEITRSVKSLKPKQSDELIIEDDIEIVPVVPKPELHYMQVSNSASSSQF